MADQENTGTIITPTNTVSGAMPTPGVAIPVLDQSEPAENIAPPAASVDPTPAEPAPTPPAPAPMPPVSTPPAGPFQPTIPPPEVPIATLPVVPKEPAAPASAAGPGAPEFGQLQPKVDAHPLFSGAKTPPPKRPRKKSRILWPLGVIIALLILAYLAVDAGLVGGANHLPFHVFKQDTVATTPSIPAAPAPTTKTQAATDPYAGWKTYSDDMVTLKYPSTWTVKRDDNTNLPNTKSLLITGPNDADLATSVGTASKAAALTVTIFESAGSPVSTSANVYGTTALANTNYPKAHLAFTADTRPAQDPTAPAAQIVATEDPTAIKGATKLAMGLSVGAGNITISANIGEAQFTDLTILENSQSFKDFVKLFNSARFQ